MGVAAGAGAGAGTVAAGTVVAGTVVTGTVVTGTVEAGGAGATGVAPGGSSSVSPGRSIASSVMPFSFKMAPYFRPYRAAMPNRASPACTV